MCIDPKPIGDEMKTIVVIIAVLVFAASAAADTLIKIESHTDDYYYGGRIHAAVDGSSEMWFGAGKIAHITETRMFVFNLDDNQLLFVNLDDSTYVETQLPLDWSACADERTLSILERYQRFGTVAGTKDSETVGGRTCKVYSAESWINTDDGRYSEREETLWISKDLPLDWSFYKQLLPHLAKLQNYRDDFAAETATMGGFPVRTDTRVYIKGFSVNSYEKVVKVKETLAPENTYSPPAGFTKKDRVTIEDLRG
jgi:hypothetical protein